MKLDRVKDYLDGSKFSNGLYVPISHREWTIPDRLSFLQDRVAGRKVIHLGCVDHLPLIEQKRREGRWLHALLFKSAERCLGIDINADGVEYVRSALGYDDVLCADILKPNLEAVTSTQWDYIVLGEILEHVDNPVSFLTQIRENYGACIDRMIITVPNAFHRENISNSLRHRECINSDHRYWFSPYTLGMVVERAGLRVEEFEFCEPAPFVVGNWKGRMRKRLSLDNLLLRRYPSLRSTLVMEARLG